MDHQRARELCALRLYDELDAEDLAPLEAHLAGCPTCSTFERELRAGLGSMLPRESPADLPPGWRERLERDVAPVPAAPATGLGGWARLAASFLLGAALAWSLSGAPGQPAAGPGAGARLARTDAGSADGSLARATPPPRAPDLGRWGLALGYLRR